MKILFVTDQFFHANNGYTITARRFKQVLEAHGHEVRVAAVGTREEGPYCMPEFHIPFFEWMVHAQGMTFAKPDTDLLEAAIGWADVTHFIAPFALSRHGMRICERLGKPMTAAFHVQPENISFALGKTIGHSELVNDLVYRNFRDYFFNHFEHVHCPSRFIATELERNGYTAKLHVISNGVDPEFVWHKCEKTPELAGKFVIGMSGRLSNEKRQDVLIRAISQSRHANEIQLVLAGQGHKKEAYEKLGAILPNPPIINFYCKEELLHQLGMWDLYVHASDAEIEAMSCMEAFASGLVPVIADSPKSATPQFALDERSLFPAGDSTALAARIDYWIEHPAQRQQMEPAYANLGKQYALDGCVRAIEQMFMEAIADQETANLAGRPMEA